MNHQHHAARMAKLKLIKDLKYGKVHLRQSLLQLSEFQDINRLFKGRKQFYSIQDIDVDIQVAHTEDNQQQANILISPAERMEIFRKDKINKKIKQRMTQGGWAKEAHAKPRVPKTSKMLQKFEAKYKNEMHISYKQQLRESELNLQKIKKNDKTRFEINNQAQKPLYQSRLVFNQSEQIQSTPRKRFISLKTSLPQKEKFVYPSIREIMQGKIKENVKGPLIDMKSLENALDTYLNQTMKRMKIKIEKDVDPKNSILNSPIKHHEMRSTSRQQQRKKAKSNVERSFNRSEQSSKKMIDTMSDFYQTKHEKKNNFDRMVKNLKYDRPLTSSIRRKNYTVVGKQTLNPIKEYREISEQERRKIRVENHTFYCKLIEGLQSYHEEDIPTTVYIVEEVKRIFETEYRITQQILKDLIDIVNTMKIDHRTEDILTQLATFVGINLSFTPHESEMK